MSFFRQGNSWAISKPLFLRLVSLFPTISILKLFYLWECEVIIKVSLIKELCYLPTLQNKPRRCYGFLMPHWLSITNLTLQLVATRFHYTTPMSSLQFKTVLELYSVVVSWTNCFLHKGSNDHFLTILQSLINLAVDSYPLKMVLISQNLILNETVLMTLLLLIACRYVKWFFIKTYQT